MYFANPVVLFATGMLVMAVLMFVWRALSKSEGFRTAADILVRVSLIWCAALLVLGMVMGINHSSAHPRCKEIKAAGQDITGCQYFFDHYGG